MTDTPEERSFKLRPYRVAMLLFSATLLLFMIGLNDSNFIRLSCRFGIFAKEMAATGGFHVFPSLYGEPYPDYPATFTYLSVLASHLPGTITFLSCALPSAAAAALTIVFIYFTGALYSKAMGLRALLITLGTFGFAASARAPVPDMFVALFTTAAFYFTIRPLVFGSSKYFWLLVPLCLVAGFAFRGPLGIVVPGAAVFSALVVERRWKLLIVFCLVSAFVSALCAGVLLYLAQQEGGDKLVRSVIDAQLSGRFSKSKPFYYYFTSGIWVYFLAFLFALASVVFNWKKLFVREPEELSVRLLRLFAAWALIILLGLSIPGTKHARYLLPMVPALSLAGALLFETPSAARLLRVVLDIFKYLPFSILALGVAALAVFRIFNLPFGFPVVAFAGSFLILSYAAIFTVRKQSSETNSAFVKLALGALCILFLQISLIEPVEQSLEDWGPFARTVERARCGRELVFYDMGPDGDELKYLVNLSTPFQPRFIYKKDDIPGLDNCVLIIKEKDLRKIPPELMKDFQKIPTPSRGGKKYLAFLKF